MGIPKKLLTKYALNAISLKHGLVKLGEAEGYQRTIYLFGKWKNNFVQKIVAVVHKKKEFYLIIGKGKLNQHQIDLFPVIASEI